MSNSYRENQCLIAEFHPSEKPLSLSQKATGSTSRQGDQNIFLQIPLPEKKHDDPFFQYSFGFPKSDSKNSEASEDWGDLLEAESNEQSLEKNEESKSKLTNDETSICNSPCPFCKGEGRIPKKQNLAFDLQKIKRQMEALQRQNARIKEQLQKIITDEWKRMSQLVNEKIQRIIYSLLKKIKNPDNSETLQERVKFLEKGIQTLKKQNDLLKKSSEKSQRNYGRFARTKANQANQNDQSQKMNSERLLSTQFLQKQNYESIKAQALINELSPTNTQRLKRIRSLKELNFPKNQQIEDICSKLQSLKSLMKKT